MKKLFNKFKWLQLMLGILLLVAGVVTIIVAIINMSVINTTLSIILAVILFALGGFAILSNFIEYDKSFFSSTLIYGSIVIAIGIVLCISRNLVADIIAYFVAVLAITLGVVGLVRGVLLIKYHARPILYILIIFLGLLFITFGILALIYNSEMLKALYIGVGALICLAGIAETIYGIQLIKQNK